MLIPTNTQMNGMASLLGMGIDHALLLISFPSSSTGRQGPGIKDHCRIGTECRIGVFDRGIPKGNPLLGVGLWFVSLVIKLPTALRPYGMDNVTEFSVRPPLAGSVCLRDFFPRFRPASAPAFFVRLRACHCQLVGDFCLSFPPRAAGHEKQK